MNVLNKPWIGWTIVTTTKEDGDDGEGDGDDGEGDGGSRQGATGRLESWWMLRTKGRLTEPRIGQTIVTTTMKRCDDVEEGV
jgi:hypothetical protein